MKATPHDFEQSTIENVNRIESFLGELGIDFAAVDGDGSLQLTLPIEHFNTRPVLFVGESTMWLFAILVQSPVSTSDLLKAVNASNQRVPFGVFYVQSGKVIFRNAIQMKRLIDADELKRFLFISASLIDDYSADLRSLVS